MKDDSTRALRVDPEFRALIPPLTREERAGLEQSILAEGVRDPIVVWGDVIVDGHNRSDIATAFGLPFATVNRNFKDRSEAEVWILRNQLNRRNLPTPVRISLARKAEERIRASQPKGGRPGNDEDKPLQSFGEVSGENREGWTDNQVAKAAGTSPENVRKQRKIDEFGDERLLAGLNATEFSMDNAYHLALVGEKFPETYAALWELYTEDGAKVRYSTPQLKHLLKMPNDATALDLVVLVETGVVSSVIAAHEYREEERKKEERRKRNEEAKRKREERKAELEAAGFFVPDIRNADFRQTTVTEKLDAIITDPPYPKEYLSLFGDLGAFAAEHLKDGGVLVCMSGQSWLPEVYALLSEHLRYHWTNAYMMPGATGGVVDRRVSSNAWKPILVYTKGTSSVSIGYDVVKSDAGDKRHHHWGQSESGFAALLHQFTEPGDLVCDPFLGGGTTGVVAYNMKRRFLGMEIDTDTYQRAAERFAA